MLRVTQKFVRRNTDEHAETAKSRAQTVPRPRRNSRDVPVPANDANALELGERYNVVWGDHAGAAVMPAGTEATLMPQTSPSVLVIRLDAIGDALALTPLLAALRD